MASNAVDALRGVALFDGLSDGELKRIADDGREEPFSPGQDIIVEGQKGGPFYLIIEGRADLLIDGKKVKQLPPGSAIGEMSLLEGETRSATVRADTHVRALAITSWNFLAILEENWDITKKVLAALSRRVRELEH